MKLKGRYVKDTEVELAPYIVDIPRGDGMTELMVLEPEEPSREIQYFQWDRPQNPKPNRNWVWVSVVAASMAGSAGVFGLFIMPTLATVIILVCLGWLGFVAFANK